MSQSTCSYSVAHWCMSVHIGACLCIINCNCHADIYVGQILLLSLLVVLLQFAGGQHYGDVLVQRCSGIVSQ